MPRFTLTVMGADGKRWSTEVEAVGRWEASSLRPAGTTVIAVHERRGSSGKGRLPSAFLLELTETLRLLSEAGLDTSEALELAAEIFTRHRRGRVVESLRDAVSKGESLSTALGRAGVPGIYTALIRIGEGIGGLDRVLPTLADYLATRKVVREKFISALLYPLFILAVLVAGTVLILTLVAPRIITTMNTLSESNASLIQAVARMEFFLNASGVICLVVAASVILFIFIYHYLPRFRLGADAGFLKVPGLGNFFLTADLMNLTFALEALTGAGVLFEAAVTQAAPVVENRALRREVTVAGERLLDGAAASAAFASGRLFPERFIRWLAIGERTGSATEAFAGLKSYYRNEYEKILTRLTGLIEPVLILLTGAFLFAAVLVFVIPLFSWYGEIL